MITANKDDTQLLVPMTEATGATLVRGQAKLVDEGEPIEKKLLILGRREMRQVRIMSLRG